MTRPVEAACAAVIAAALFASAPAKAQFAGIDENQMQQVAPMLEMMKQQMGKQRFAQLMKTMGPMMEKMQSQGGLGGMASMDMGQMDERARLDEGPPGQRQQQQSPPPRQGQGAAARVPRDAHSAPPADLPEMPRFAAFARPVPQTGADLRVSHAQSLPGGYRGVNKGLPAIPL